MINRKFAILAAAALALAFSMQNADAQGRHRPAAVRYSDHSEKKLAAVSLGVGAAATVGTLAINDWHLHHWRNSSGLTEAGAFVLTTVGCIALSPIVATIVLDRPLTQREAGELAGSCIIPIIGGWIVGTMYDAHPEWDPEDAARRRGRPARLFSLFTPDDE
ncbi:MAG TPA: hypothetical protein VFX37_00665 [Pseudolabrys sp.]|nr:hypothetical protein [Pseudolabrys sp.]